MTSINRFSTIALVAAFLAAGAVAQDYKKAAPAPAASPKAAADAKSPAKDTAGVDRKVLVDNEKVLVTETVYKPGVPDTMRERGLRVTRALTDGTMERVYADGKKETIHWKAGEVKYQPKANFSNKNVGKTDMKFFTVTLK